MWKRTDYSGIIEKELIKYWEGVGTEASKHKNFNQQVIKFLSDAVKNEKEAIIATGIVMGKVRRLEEDLSYGDAFPGQYDHHGFPTMYDIYMEAGKIYTNDAFALAMDKAGIKRLIREELKA